MCNLWHLKRWLYMCVYVPMCFSTAMIWWHGYFVEEINSTSWLYFLLSLCCAKSLQSWLTLCNPMDCGPLGSSVREILWTWILEWVALSSSSRSSRPKQGLNPPLSSLLHSHGSSLPLTPPGKALLSSLSLKTADTPTISYFEYGCWNFLFFLKNIQFFSFCSLLY